MKIRLNTPNFVKRKTSEFVSEKISNELGGECCIKITEAEFGMKDKKVYSRFAMEGDMDRTEFMKLIKMLIAEGI